MRRPLPLIVSAFGIALAATVLAQSAGSEEEVARRQLESGRAFAKQGNYTEALKDFHAVADTHASSSVADDAWLEIARYYLDVAGDPKEASTAVDAILKKYPTSNSAPDAYVMAGRLSLSHGHLAPDLDAALANFERVPRLFPSSDAVPPSLSLGGETLWLAGRFNDALGNFGRVEVEYPSSIASADAYLGAGKALVALGDPISAMLEMQQARNRWPKTAEAATALARITLLNRLYLRARSGPAFALTSETAGPAKIDNVNSMVATSRDAVYWANDTLVGIGAPANADKPPAVTKSRGITLDAAGNLVAIDGGLVRLSTGGTVAMLLPKSNGTPETLTRIDAVAQLSNGDWLVMDGGEKAIHRFGRAGAYVGPFAQIKVSRLAVSPFDEVAGIDRDQKGIALFDASGKSLGRIPLKGTGYDLQNPEDLAFDAFGHLYVLDRVAIAVFSPYPAEPAAAAGQAPRPATRSYRLLTVFSEPEKSQTGFHKATAFAIDSSGGLFLYDGRAQRILVYR